MVEKFPDRFSRFVTIPECDSQPPSQPPSHVAVAITLYAIASSLKIIVLELQCRQRSLTISSAVSIQYTKTDGRRDTGRQQRPSLTIASRRKQEAQLMLSNPRDAFRGPSRSPNIVPFQMLGTFPMCNSNFVFKMRRFFQYLTS